MSVVDERNEYGALAECDWENPEYEAKNLYRCKKSHTDYHTKNTLYLERKGLLRPSTLFYFKMT